MDTDNYRSHGVFWCDGHSFYRNRLSSSHSF